MDWYDSPTHDRGKRYDHTSHLLLYYYSLCVYIHFTPSPTLTPQYTILPSIPLSVVPDLPLPGLTVSPPHCDHWLMHYRLLSYPTVCVVEEHSY